MRILTILLLVFVVACSSPPATEPTPSPVDSTTSTVGPVSTTTAPTTTTTSSTTPTNEADPRSKFFAAVDAEFYKGMSEDDVWRLVEGFCSALDGGLTAQEIIDQTLAETGGIIDLTDLAGVLTELHTCG